MTRIRSIDKDGLILCTLQAEAFESSVDEVETSSEIFMRRFLNSDVSKEIDNKYILSTNMRPDDIIDRIDEQYGRSSYGSVKYSKNEMYWIGYIYRYFCYTYGFSSAQAYRKIKPKELRSVFLPYHTMDPAQAIERILEAKGIHPERVSDIEWQYRKFKEMRKAEGKYVI